MKNSILLSYLLMFTIFCQAQVAENSDLFKKLKVNDSLLFDVGFNTCDMKTSASLITDDMEFYHDKGGVTTSKAQFLEIMKNGICKSPDFVSRRLLIEGSLKVYPLYDSGNLYGAIQEGIHKFFEKPKGQPERDGSIARFTHLWLLQGDGSWKIARVLSYDHLMETPQAKKMQPMVVSEEILKKYAGKYEAPQTGKVLFTVESSGLRMEAGEMKLTLLPMSETKFYNQQASLTFEFVTADSGKVLKCIVRENDKVVEEAQRIDH